jgi:hypothetical protein
MVEKFVNDELERKWKQADVAKFEVLGASNGLQKLKKIIKILSHESSGRDQVPRSLKSNVNH